MTLLLVCAAIMLGVVIGAVERAAIVKHMDTVGAEISAKIEAEVAKLKEKV